LSPFQCFILNNLKHDPDPNWRFLSLYFIISTYLPDNQSFKSLIPERRKACRSIRRSCKFALHALMQSHFFKNGFATIHNSFILLASIGPSSSSIHKEAGWLETKIC
jgi:hypothetical protein